MSRAATRRPVAPPRRHIDPCPDRTLTVARLGRVEGRACSDPYSPRQGELIASRSQRARAGGSCETGAGEGIGDILQSTTRLLN